MVNGDPLPYLFDLLSVRQMITVSFLPMLRSAHLLTVVLSEFSESVPPLKQQLSPSNPSRSRSLYNIYLGLHPYVQHGVQSSLEIAVDCHEGAVPLSTIPAIY